MCKYGVDMVNLIPCEEFSPKKFLPIILLSCCIVKGAYLTAKAAILFCDRLSTPYFSNVGSLRLAALKVIAGSPVTKAAKAASPPPNECPVKVNGTSKDRVFAFATACLYFCVQHRLA